MVCQPRQIPLRVRFVPFGLYGILLKSESDIRRSAVTSRLKASLDMLSTVAVIIIAAVVVWNQFVGKRRDDRPKPDLLNNVVLDADRVTKRLGSAAVILVEFADFQCPYCAQHTIQTMPRIKKELIEPGIVSYAYFHFPVERLHPDAFKASEAAECAGRQGKYWEMHEMLFAKQSALVRPI